MRRGEKVARGDAQQRTAYMAQRRAEEANARTYCAGGWGRAFVSHSDAAAHAVRGRHEEGRQRLAPTPSGVISGLGSGRSLRPRSPPVSPSLSSVFYRCSSLFDCLRAALIRVSHSFRNTQPLLVSEIELDGPRRGKARGGERTVLLKNKKKTKKV